MMTPRDGIRALGSPGNWSPRTTFTVFTPTYNRVGTLHRVYESLKDQTFRDFEWLIVDDGSIDGTAMLVEHWRREADFPIRYYWKEHNHKKSAFNKGVQMAHGELFLSVDSDDKFPPDALEIFFEEWTKIPSAERGSFSSVCGLCEYPDGAIVGTGFPGGWGVDSDPIEIRLKHKVAGDKWGFTKTEILKQFPFPEYLPGHVPESVVWFQVAKRFRTRYVNRRVHIYVQGANDQLTRQPSPTEHAAGHLYWMRVELEEALPWFRRAVIHFLLSAARWTRFRLHVRGVDCRFFPRNAAGRALVVLMAPFGLSWWLYDHLRAKWSKRSPRAD